MAIGNENISKPVIADFSNFENVYLYFHYDGNGFNYYGAEALDFAFNSFSEKLLSIY